MQPPIRGRETGAAPYLLNALAGSRMMARSNSNTPSTAIPNNRNGRAISQTIGHNRSAMIASGQQSTNKRTHKRKLIIV